jgi:hypothetical protein
MTHNLKRIRRETHWIFDYLWASGFMERNDAYNWLAQRLQIHRSAAHISLLSEKDCIYIQECVKKLVPIPSLVELEKISHYIDDAKREGIPVKDALSAAHERRKKRNKQKKEKKAVRELESMSQADGFY